MCNEVLNSNSHTISSFIGKTATQPNIPFCKLHYRSLEWDKISAIRISKGDFDAILYAFETCYRGYKMVDS